jgi:protein-S-isoprenylcysteine O-methyltransferase Ste14
MQTPERSKLALKVPPVVVLLVALIAVYIHDQLFPLGNILGESRYMLAQVLFALAIFIAIAGIVSFKRAKTTVNPVQIEKASNLVTSGMFRITRNPMYLGMLLLVIGFAIRLDNPIALIWAVVFQQYMNRFQIFPEERMLAFLFGDAYENYMTRVRRWL